MARKKGKRSKKNENNSLKIAVLVILIIIFGIIFINNSSTDTDIAATLANSESKEMKNFFEEVETSTVASVSKYIVYGTHLNFEGEITITNQIDNPPENVQVIIKDFDGNETSIETDFEYSDNTISFSTLDEINSGLDLENITSEVEFFLLKTTFSNNEIAYYSMSNDTEYTDNIEYYTLTKNNSNNKIDIFWGTYNEISYFALTNSSIRSLPDDVYDIVIDAGHGGTDCGAVSSDGKYYESDLVLEYALSLGKELEDAGLKVLLTRDGTEDEDENMAYTMYDEDGRVNVANASGAKILISLHMNSNEDFVYDGGVEVYVPNDCDITFARLLADNIVTYANTTYSPLDTYKKDDGVYLHTFTESEIQSFANSAREGGYKAYNITSSTPYFYMIRETRWNCYKCIC